MWVLIIVKAPRNELKLTGSIIKKHRYFSFRNAMKIWNSPNNKAVLLRLKGLKMLSWKLTGSIEPLEPVLTGALIVKFGKKHYQLIEKNYTRNFVP